MPHHTATAAEDPRLRIVSNRRIVANLFFQQLLYYQVWYSIAWIIFWFAWLCKTYWVGLTLKDDDTVRTVFMLFYILVEPIRLSAGRYGNLQENVPWLVLFCILSVAPLHGTVYYILLYGYDMNRWSKAVQITQALCLEIELVVGLYVVFSMYRQQKDQYYLFEFAMNQRRNKASVKPVSAKLTNKYAVSSK